MGTIGCYHPLDHALVGKELHGTDRFLYRLYADVREVPYGGLDPRHSGVYDSAAGYAGVKGTVYGLQFTVYR